MSSVPSGASDPVARAISARIRSARGTPPRRIPTKASFSRDPCARARSSTSWAIRWTARCTASAFMSSLPLSRSPLRTPVRPLLVHGQVHPVDTLDDPVQERQLEGARVLEGDVQHGWFPGPLPEDVLLADV